MLNKRIEIAVWVLCAFIALTMLLLPTVPNDTAVMAASCDRDITVIIDAGHGGEDGGAVSLSGVYESSINLAIARKLEQTFALMGVCPVMTREKNEIDYPEEAKTLRAKKVFDQKSRVELVNKTQNGVLISIHQNKYPDGSPSGAQVLYAPTDGSDIFASAMQAALTDTIGESNVRLATQISSDIYLMKSINCPAILIECGFLSNFSDEAQLITPEYQLKLAAGIACGYIRAEDSLKSVTTHDGGINEDKNLVFLH